jgi:broad specificity phosphatase PhoE
VELLLVRHGVTAHNVGRIFMGWDPVPLAPEGREQVARLGERLRGERIDRLVASDVARALESAEILSRATGLPVERATGLREVDVGDARGIAYDEAERRWPGILSPEGEVRFPGGESFADLADRATGYLRESVIRESEERVLVVCHGGVVRGIAARMLGRPLRDLDPFAVDNASLSILRIVAGRTELALWNDTAHLA